MDCAGRTGTESETALVAICVSIISKSWQGEGNEDIVSRLAFRGIEWDGKDTCAAKDVGISRPEEKCTEGTEVEKFGCTKVGVEDEIIGFRDSDVVAKPTAIVAWFSGALFCIVKGCDTADGDCKGIRWCGWSDISSDAPLYPCQYIGKESAGGLAIWV